MSGLVACNVKRDRAALNAARQVVSKELRMQKDRMRKRLKRCSPTYFSEAVQTLVLAVYSLSSYNMGYAVECLQTSRSHGRKHQKLTIQDAQQLVEDWFINANAASLASFELPETPQAKRTQAKARRWLAECSVRSHIHDKNSRGLTVPLSSFLDKYAEVVVEHDDDLPLAYRRDNSASRNKMLAKRFRRRWGLKVGKIGVRDHLDENLLREKVCFVSKKKAKTYSLLWHHFWARILGRILGPQDSINTYTWAEKRAQKWSHLF